MLTMNVESALNTVSFNDYDDVMGVVLCADRWSFGPLTPEFYTMGDMDYKKGPIDTQWKSRLQDLCRGDEKVRVVNVFVKEFDLFGPYLVIFVNGESFDLPPLID